MKLPPLIAALIASTNPGATQSAPLTGAPAPTAFVCPLPIRVAPELLKLSGDELRERLANDAVAIAARQHENTIISLIESISQPIENEFPERKSEIRSIVTDESMIMWNTVLSQIPHIMARQMDKSFPPSDYYNIITMMEDPSFYMMLQMQSDSKVLAPFNKAEIEIIRKCRSKVDNIAFNEAILAQAFSLDGKLFGAIEKPKLLCRITKRLSEARFEISEDSLIAACKATKA